MRIEIEYVNKECALKKGSEGAMAFDVRANIKEPIVIKAGDTVNIPLGFKVDTGKATVGMLLMMRSGLAGKHGLMLMNSVGLIDSDFRGECIAAIWNTGTKDKEFIINPLERIGQVIFVEDVCTELVEVEHLSDTERGTGGFGSTGRG